MRLVNEIADVQPGSDLRTQLARAYWFCSALLLSVGPGVAEAGVPGGAAVALTGAAGVATLLWFRAPGAFAVVPAILVGLNLTVLTLLVWPPCESSLDLRIVDGATGIEIECMRHQDMTSLALLSVGGSIVVVGLLVLLRWLRGRNPGRPSTS